MTPKKKIKEIIKRGVRRIKHRKGFGVHSPFAYDVITEVIEEKLPYYAYRDMKSLYGKQSPIPFKVACLLLRLSNRFHCRRLAEVGCDGGYSLLPLTLVDRRNSLTAYGEPSQLDAVTSRLGVFFPEQCRQVTVGGDMRATDDTYDMMVINGNPLGDSDALVEWVMAHCGEQGVIFVHGIQERHELEAFWDSLCDRDDVPITMDLYDFGLAILKPRFFKQHYIVSF